MVVWAMFGEIKTEKLRWTSPLFYTKKEWECPRSVMVNAMDCGIVVREFVLQSRYYVQFRTNTIGKGMNPLILPAMD